MSPLSDTEVDSLGGALEHFARDVPNVSFHRYPLCHVRPDNPRKLGVLRAVGLPAPGLTTSVTFGLAHQTWTQANFPDRVELVYAWNDSASDHEALLVQIAEMAVYTPDLVPRPGRVYIDAAAHAGLAGRSPMPHALLVYPYLWGDDFKGVDVSEQVRVWFLQVVPLHDDEAQFIDANGFAAFEQIIQAGGPNLHQLDRHSRMPRR